MTGQHSRGAGERIKIDRSRPWGSVPESLIEDRRLSPKARLVACWLCVRPPGWIVRRRHLLDRLGIGLDSWWRVRRELLQHGYLVVHQSRTAGRFSAAELEFFPQPDLAAATATAQGFTEHGSTVLGSSELGKHGPLTVTALPVTVLPKTPQPKKQRTKTVVVSETKEKETGTLQLHWPPGLPEDITEACKRAVSTSRRPQQLVDELAGALNGAKKQVTNPAAWLRRLAKLDHGDALVLEHAAGVAAARLAKQAAIDRERLALGGQCQSSQSGSRLPPSPATTKAARDAAMAAYRAKTPAARPVAA